MTELTKNFAVSTVATAPSPATSGTSLVVASGHGTRFPTPPFNAVVAPIGDEPDPSNAEVVRVTGISTDTFTIARTQESSSARTVVVGDRIWAGPTAKTFRDLAGDHAKVYRTTDDSTFASGTSRAIPFDNEAYDVTSSGSNDQHDNSTNPSRLIVKTAGVYLVSFNLSMDLTGGLGGNVVIRKNGSTTLFLTGNPPGTIWYGSTLDSADVSDYYEAVVTNATTVTRGVVASGFQPWFAMSRIGATS